MTPPLLHERELVPHAEEDAAQVDGHDAVELLGRIVLEEVRGTDDAAWVWLFLSELQAASSRPLL
jgi:hypothetical protein